MTAREAASGLVSAIGPRLDGRPFVVLLDVDGTLAPIAPRPSDARVPDETRAVVERLIVIPGAHVALVSGRSAEDAIGVAGVSRVWAIGNHGMEVRAPDGDMVPDPEVQPFEERISRVARELESVAREVAGAFLEDKRWTLSLHYRLAPDREVPPMLAKARAVAEQAGLRVSDGKKVLEVRPPVAIDKGTASVRLADRLGALAQGSALFFAGDDRTDEDAFRALRQRATHAVTVRVGDEGATDAEFRVPSPDALRALLAAIAARREVADAR